MDSRRIRTERKKKRRASSISRFRTLSQNGYGEYGSSMFDAIVDIVCQLKDKKRFRRKRGSVQSLSFFAKLQHFLLCENDVWRTLKRFGQVRQNVGFES